MGGLGKTTLTKRVYDDPQMAGKYFNCRAWITVSQTVNLNVLLRDIIRKVLPHDYKVDLEKMQKKDLIEELKKLLQNRRYIIVLDDIWNIDAWESIKHALPENENRSRVVVTTRIKDVANNCCAGADGVNYVCELQLLSKEKSLELFEKRVFGLGKHCPEHLKKVENDVVMKCDGLPLAICAMAGILKTIPNLDDPQQWTKLLENLSSLLETNPRLEGMKHVLLLSYNHLPYLLKPCFLYLSIFPEDHLIKCKNLIQLWIAEGLVSNQNAMRAEVVAEYYFNELVNRSLILPFEVGWNGKVKSFRVHDVMLEVLIFKSMEENMVSILGKQSKTTLNTENVIRRLSLQGESNEIRGILDDVDLSRVTSLSIYDYKKTPAMLQRFRLLRVLVFENHYFFSREEKESFLRILCKLRHLRYLSLKGTNTKLGFSKSFSKLQNLVTLDLRDEQDIFYEDRRRHQLNSSVAKLKQLRHLLMTCSSIELGVLRNLKDLQTLVGLHIDNVKKAEELGYLTQLMHLKIIVSITPTICSSLCVSLKKLSESLLSFTMFAIAPSKEIFDLDLKNPPSLLQSFQMGANIKIPDCLGSLSNLAKLGLSIEKMDDLEVIKTLPNLLCLTIFNNLLQELSFSTGGFQNLKTLKIELPLRIEFLMDCMPILQKLVFYTCWDLALVGIGFLPCLQEILLIVVPKRILEVVKSEAENHKNILKLMAFRVE
ncbi:Disease resistance protein RPM1 [Dendrobium catenatum]|uniref:Disease resistance protein RPM1 n=2 Tax=Dendrobium catenatum TaxID=906689 RepID=A0A2I0XA96_9ASPA|nr:Disease resistance protein RPM1 [Dendrobium catenatum]